MAAAGPSSKLVQAAKNFPARVWKGVDVVSKMLPKQKVVDPTLNGFSSATSLSFPNSRMIPGLDQTVDIPVKTLLTEAPKEAWEQTKVSGKLGR